MRIRTRPDAERIAENARCLKYRNAERALIARGELHLAANTSLTLALPRALAAGCAEPLLLELLSRSRLQKSSVEQAP